MVGDGLELELEAVGGAEVKGLGGAEPEDEGLLMLVAPEDEALPVDPGVQSGYAVLRSESAGPSRGLR